MHKTFALSIGYNLSTHLLEHLFLFPLFHLTIIYYIFSLLQKTLKIRPKTRLVNPSYPPHIWHQQSMDPKFVEKGLTPIDLMTVKKKLEVSLKVCELIPFLHVPFVHRRFKSGRNSKIHIQLQYSFITANRLPDNIISN